MKNAASYMTSEAQEGAIAFGSIDEEDMSLRSRLETICHFERNEVESRNLMGSLDFARDDIRR